MSLARQTTLPDQAAAWLHRVVRNAAISAVRGRKRRNQREARSLAARPGFPRWTIRSTPGAPPDFWPSSIPRRREVIVARLWGGLTFDQIARLQGCSLTTAHRRYQAWPGTTSREAGTTMFNSDQDRLKRSRATVALVGSGCRGPRPRSDAVRGRPSRGSGSGSPGTGRAGGSSRRPPRSCSPPGWERPGSANGASASALELISTATGSASRGPTRPAPGVHRGTPGEGAAR